MSYTLRVKTPALGLLDLPDYQSLSFGQEFSDVGGIDITYAKQGVNAAYLKDEAIIVVYWDDAELDNCRYTIQSGDKDKDPTENYFTVKGKSVLDVFRRVIVRRTAAPGQPVQFNNSTPGFILRTFIEAAKARGRLIGITFNFTDSVDSAGVPWPKTHTTEYKPGVTYLQVLHDLVDKGFIEISMSGDTLKTYVAESMGVDRTLGINPLELRHGLDYMETPNQWSSEVRSGYSLIVGDEGTYAEFEDNTTAPGPYGRAEQSISQGGISDSGALNLINLYSLQTVSTTTEQFTRRVNIRENGYSPGIDYKVGDWIFDRVNDTPQRYRVLSIAIGVEDGAISDAALVLNDKFMERAIRTQRKIDGITGGGSGAGGGGGIPTDAPDYTIPKPPTGVGTTAASYVDPVDGRTKVVASTSWNNPTQNTDNSQLTDLEGFQSEYRTSKKSDYAALTKWYPARTDLPLQSRFDRRGKDKVNNWVGADGGASARSAAGEDWFFWSDTSWGTMDKTGKINMNAMPRNTITISDPTSGSDLRGQAGKTNLVPEGIALLTDAASTWMVTSCSRTIETTMNGGANGRWLKAVATAATANPYAYRLLPQGTITEGKSYLLVAKIDKGTATNPRYYVSFYNAAGSQMATNAQQLVPDAEGWCRKVVVAPAGATTCYQMLALGTSVIGTWAAISMFGVFETNHALQSWQPPIHHEDIYNEVVNPDGKTTSTQSADELVLTNYSPNPSGETADGAWSLYAGTTKSRIVDASAWTGGAVIRLTNGTASAGLGSMHYPVPISANTGYVARARIRGTAGKTLTGQIANYNVGSGTGGGGASTGTITLTSTSTWQEVVFPPSSGAPTANNLGLQFIRTGTWAIGDYFEVDGVEIYEGEGLPPFYFDGAGIKWLDGATPTPELFRTSWNGTADASTSSLYRLAEVRRNYLSNPALYNGLAEWAAFNSTVRRDESDVYGEAPRAFLPEVTNAAALTPWFTALSQAGTRSVGLAIAGDSCTESTGSMDNKRLDDRFIERLQNRLRRETAVAGVPVSPKGYYGASTYIPAGYLHDGPVDWLYTSADTAQYPISSLQSGLGAGGRFRNITAGVRASLTATFDRIRISFGKSGFGRNAVISIDGTVMTTIETFGTDKARTSWLSPALPHGEHIVTVEYAPMPGIWQGSVILYGADIFDRDYTKGVRVYDLAGSGKAAQDAASSTRTEIEDGFDRGRNIDMFAIKLGFNDAGRDAAWGGPRTAAQFKADILTMISRARATGFTGPTLLIGQWEASQLTTTEPQANYRAKLKEIANADSKVAFIDLSTVMPSTDYAPWGNESFYVDGLHPSVKGMERVAEILHGVLSPTSLAVRPASALVTVTNASAQRGVVVTPTNNTLWPVGTPYVCGMWVKAPVGARMQFRWLAVGNDGGTINFVATGAWQWIASDPMLIVAGAASGPYMIMRTETAQSITFRVTKGIISRSGGPYFDGNTWNTDTTTYSWTGAAGSSQSVMRERAVSTWSAAPTTPAIITFDPTRWIEGEGSVCATALTGGQEIGVVYGAIANLVAGKYVTVIATTSATYAMSNVKVELLDASNAVLATSNNAYVQANGWAEARLNYFSTVAPRFVRVTAQSAGNVPAGSKMWVTELTVVSHDSVFWRGTPFHGGQHGNGIATSWLGTPHASRSLLEAYNSSSILSKDQVSALLHPAAAGGAISDYLWITSAGKKPGSDRAFVIANGMRNRAVKPVDGWNFQRNGSIYIIEYDMTTKSIVTFKQWFDDPKIQWGEACWFEGSYFYVYGASGGDYVGRAHIMRVPASDPINGPRQFWTGTQWSGTEPAATIATFSSPGAWTAVRTFNGQWIALFLSGRMDQVDGWTAPAPEGPWTRMGIVHEFAEDHTISLKYVPRFHPQLDSNEKGIAISYSASGQNGNQKYGAEFLRGPAGDISLSMDGSDWGERVPLDTAPDIRGGFSSGYLFAPRVRAYDKSGNASDWAYGEPVYLQGDTVAPPQPDKPFVLPFLRGIRVSINGLTAGGGSQPRDFYRFAIHTSYEEGFEPDESNLYDSIYTSTGGVSVESNLNWGAERYVKVVTWDSAGNASIPSEAASAMAERLSDAYLPDKLIDGAKHIKDESVSFKQLTVGALDNSIVPNGGMEDWDGQAILPSGWVAGWPRGTYTDWDTAATFSVDTTRPISGSKSVSVTTTALSSRQLMSKQFPLTPGDIYYVKMVVRVSRKLAGNYITLNLLAGEAPDAVNGFGDPRGAVLFVGAAGPGTETYTIEGQVEVPDYFADGTGYAMRYGAIGIDCGPDGQSPYTAWIDDVEVRQVVGEAAIANASINRAKIRYLAVDDARISNVGVGKLIAGELWADITVSSRIMTSKTGQRVEMNRDGLFGYNGTDIEPVTEVRADNGGLVSRWFRTNTLGTRIEMGTYGTGSSAALMAFFPNTGSWQFPPALGYGGANRVNINIPGIGVHAGSLSEAYYQKYGMNMIGVDQVGGIGMVTGNLLDGAAATDGAPIRINAGGSKGFIEIKTGGADKAQLVLRPDFGESFLSLHRGSIRFANLGPTDSYRMEFVAGSAWMGINHMLLDTGGGAFRVAQSEMPNALVLRGGNLTLQSGRIEADSLVGTGLTAGVVRTTGGNGMRWDNDGNPLIYNSGSTRATSAFWVDEAGLVNGGGAWGVPKIKVRAQDSYISWDSSGSAFVDGREVKTFVIPHPKDSKKYLVHAAHEGDEMRVIYEGTSYTKDGEVIVDLPDYFDSLTLDDSAVVLLSPMLCKHGSTCSCMIKSGPVLGNQFRVYANTTSHDVPFAWRVTAVRINAEFSTEPLVSETTVRGDGPYTYITQ